MLVHRLALRGEDRAVGFEQILALHARAARPRADQHGDLGILERDFRIIGDDDLLQQRERAILQLHHHAPQCRQRGRDFQQLQDDRLVAAEHVAIGDAEQQGVADLAGGAGDGDANGGFHAKTFDFGNGERGTGTGNGESRIGCSKVISVVLDGRLARRFKPFPPFHVSRFTSVRQRTPAAMESIPASCAGRAGVADPQRMRFAECRTGHAGHTLGFQQRAAEIHVVAECESRHGSRQSAQLSGRGTT